MSKVYDPIMCMMVEEKSKVRDVRTSDESWGVFKSGGSAGEKTSYFVKEGMSESEAKEMAKRRNAGLSKGEKEYYKIKYTAKRMSDSKSAIDKAIRVMDADQTFYVEIKSTMKGVEGRTIMVKASNKAEAKKKAESEAGQYGRVGKVTSREESRAQAGNHGVISNNWKR